VSEPEETAGEESEAPVAGVAAGEPSERLPETLPVLVLRNTVIFPALITPMLATTPRARRVVEDALASDRLMLALAARSTEAEEPGPEQLHEVGTVVRILRMVETETAAMRLWVQGVRRARVAEWRAREPALRARIAVLEDELHGGLEIEALRRNVARQFVQLSGDAQNVPEAVRTLVASLEDPAVLSDVVAANAGLSLRERQELLETTDVQQRLEKLSIHLAREREVRQLEEEIKEEVQSELSRSQREYVLREQARAIRRQLGEASSPTEQVEELRKRLEQADPPEEARAQAERELGRLASMPPGAMEAGTIRNYVEWIVDLPWKQETEDSLDVAGARAVLEEDHYDLEKVKDRILEFIAVAKLKRELRGPILCFVGPPGTGKTSLGRSIARSLGRRFARISLGGVRDEAEIRGHRRTYVGALPGRIVQTLRSVGTRNPVVLLDEVDKLGADFRGDPSSALLEVLDPEQNHAFSDHYLEVPLDLSKVLFIATANLLERIPPPLRDRMEVIEVPGYTEEDKLEIARRYLWPRQLERSGVKDRAPRLPDETILAVARGWTREAGLRNLERELGKLARKIARRVVEEGSAPAEIAPADLVALLGPAHYQAEVAGRVQNPGVSVGLAVTEAGGEILFVEASRMPGKGRLKITGSLGDVMRESVQTALSVVRTRAQALGIDAERFRTSDFHVHVPAGATPKDGPSAGIAIATALTSLLTDRRVPPDLAMTGEITLRGRVLPIGGVKEKVLAARRAGIGRVLLPAENAKDLAEIPESRLGSLKIEYVETIEQVVRLVFGEDALR
jgi:ATP-dependent Lon protease